MASGAYRKPPQEPLSFNHTSETLVHKAKEFCAQHNQAITDLMAQIDPETAKFDNFLLRKSPQMKKFEMLQEKQHKFSVQEK